MIRMTWKLEIHPEARISNTSYFKTFGEALHDAALYAKEEFGVDNKGWQVADAETDVLIFGKPETDMRIRITLHELEEPHE
ncbi:MAG: hypothetical protein C0602_00295 [Denitrovibrio sp.]|nr:MAG: hypothetical protein C0602_00295 [Denitrovibrio sp.]